MKKVIIKICLTICMVAASFSIWKLYGFYRTYQNGKDEYDKLKEYVKENKPSEKEKKKKGKQEHCPISVDFNSLRKINPDVVGWIYIPGTDINYPILQAEDNSTYLHMTFRKKKSYVGAIFLDAGCAPDFSDFNSIIYGHNLKNGEMFGHLKRLYDINYNKKANYKKHPKIWILTPDGSRLYHIFACREINVKNDKDVYTINISGKNEVLEEFEDNLHESKEYLEESEETCHESEDVFSESEETCHESENVFSESEERKTFLEKQISRSQIKTGIKFSGMESIITLSTCTSTTREGRFIVQAYRHINGW